MEAESIRDSDFGASHRLSATAKPETFFISDENGEAKIFAKTAHAQSESGRTIKNRIATLCPRLWIPNKTSVRSVFMITYQSSWGI